MAFEKVFTMDEVCNRVALLDSVQEDRILKPTGRNIPKFSDFGEYGLASAGSKIGFPAAFVDRMANTGHEDLANKIIRTTTKDYQRSGRPLLLRKWDGKIEGVLTDKYGVFDDSEVMDILSTLGHFLCFSY